MYALTSFSFYIFQRNACAISFYQLTLLCWLKFCAPIFWLFWPPIFIVIFPICPLFAPYQNVDTGQYGTQWIKTLHIILQTPYEHIFFHIYKNLEKLQKNETFLAALSSSRSLVVGRSVGRKDFVK